jgi:hypothetical protein
MPFDPLAVLAMKGSQVLAAMARLDGRQFHGRSARGALRPLVLSVEHMSPSLDVRAADQQSMLPRLPGQLLTIAHFSK